MERSLYDHLATTGQMRQLAPGEILCAQGDESETAFLVVDGTIQTLVDTSTGQVALAQHGPGALIGEVTALVGGQRTATLVAVGSASVRVIPRGDLRDAFDRFPEESQHIATAARDRTDRSRVANLLAEELGTTDEAAIAAIADRVSWVNLTAGEQLFAAGDQADAAYLVLSGRLAVISPEGRTVAQVGRGSIVGEFGLLENRTRTATINALRDADLARLDGADFAGLATNHTGLAMGLVRRIVERSGEETAPGNRIGRTACVVITAPGDGRAMTNPMAVALQEVGSTGYLWPERIDELLGAEGAAATEPGNVGDIRLVELLYQMEVDNDYLLLAATPDQSNWMGRAIRLADQVVVICSAQPTRAEDAEIRDILALVPENTPAWLALNHPANTDRARGTAAIRDSFGVDEVLHVVDGRSADLARVARLAVGEGYGLVLSGGGARGFAHLGVVANMEERGIPIDRISAASMGAVMGAGIAEGVPPDERVDLALRQFRRLLDYTVPFVSLTKAKRISRTLTNQWGDYDIEDLWLPFCCSATNLTTSETIMLNRGPVVQAVRASTALPGVMPPVPFEGDLLVDGGILDNLPVDSMINDPSIGTIIAIDVAPPRGPRAKSDYGLSVSGMAALRDRLSRGKNKYPDVATILMRTMLVAAARDRDRAVASGKVDLYLDLELFGVSLLEFDSVPKAAAMGREASAERLDRWWSERQAARSVSCPDADTNPA